MLAVSPSNPSRGLLCRAGASAEAGCRAELPLQNGPPASGDPTFNRMIPSKFYRSLREIRERQSANFKVCQSAVLAWRSGMPRLAGQAASCTASGFRMMYTVIARRTNSRPAAPAQMPNCWSGSIRRPTNCGR